MAKKNKSKKKTTKSKSIISSDQDALTYHEYASMDKSKRLPGKIEVVSTKPVGTQRDLSLAYSPGVAAASSAIARDARKASAYTSRANLVAVVTNGTAVLGLGNIGPLAAKPVMEGKAILFKRYADINVFDIELNAKTPKEVIQACQMLEPTVGGINLEDIKAPDCFEIEEELRKKLKIPVFHDDQHGTAIIVAAAFLNALHLTKRKAERVKIVFSGAGAAAMACAKMLMRFKVRKSNIIMCDQHGVIHPGREHLDPFKASMASKTRARSLSQALKGADVFIGLSVGGVVTKPMVKGMGKKPIIFALANPTPEISYEDAKSARPDAIVATGRSDYPNQINNVLGFPFIFRGALDVEATTIDDKMEMAAAKALAQLAREGVPEAVSRAYGEDKFVFGPDYIIPKPVDQRALLWVAPAVAKAAMDSKIARKKIDLDEYGEQLARIIDPSRQIMSVAVKKARQNPTSLVLPEGTQPKILKAAEILAKERIAKPILLGNPQEIAKLAKSLQVDLKAIRIVDPATDRSHEAFAQRLHHIRERRGMSLHEADRQVSRKNIFGLMMIESGLADAFVSGIAKNYPETLRPALQIIRLRSDRRVAAGLYIVLVKDRVLFVADTTVNIDPSAEELAEISLMAAEKAEDFNITPRIALLSFSNFGSSYAELNSKIQTALKIIQKKRPELMVDGEVQADTAVTEEILARYPFSYLKQPANVLIFPNLAAGNISYKLLQRLGGAEVIGPILMGMNKPVHILQQGASVEEVVSCATVAAAEASCLKEA